MLEVTRIDPGVMMAEHPNAELLRRAYKAFAAQDTETLSELIAEDAVFHVAGSSPISGDYRGREAIFGFFMRVAQETQGTFRLDVHDVLANDEHSVGLVRASAERGGNRYEQNQVHVYHVNDRGQASEFWGFPEDTAATDEFWS